MFNPFDMLQTPGGAGLQTFGRQVGLTPDQTRRAMEALLPALTIGLQQNAAHDPLGFARLFGFGVPGRPAPAPPAELPFGGLFGSPAIAQAVIQQAAAASGVGTQALRQMLPAMAGMIVAGIVHMMLNPPPAPGTTPSPAAPAPYGFPANLWTDWLGGIPSSGSPTSAKSVPPQASRSARTVPKPGTHDAKAAPDPSAVEGPFAALQQMFQTGADVHEQNVTAMRAIFETFWSNPAGSDGVDAAVGASAAAPAPSDRKTPKPPRG